MLINALNNEQIYILYYSRLPVSELQSCLGGTNLHASDVKSGGNG